MNESYATRDVDPAPAPSVSRELSLVVDALNDCVDYVDCVLKVRLAPVLRDPKPVPTDAEAPETFDPMECTMVRDVHALLIRARAIRAQLADLEDRLQV